MINSLSNGMMKFFNKHDNNDLYKVVKTRVGSSNPYNSVIRKPYRMGQEKNVCFGKNKMKRLNK